VLDLGCNCGSDLDILRREGFTQLLGVDAGRAALAIFEERYPETWSTATISHDLFQRYLRKFPSRGVDVIHSHGATIELVHPSFPIVKHLSRIADRSIFLQIEERGHTYPRNYISEFAWRGFRLVYADRFSKQLDEQSLLHFERM